MTNNSTFDDLFTMPEVEKAQPVVVQQPLATKTTMSKTIRWRAKAVASSISTTFVVFDDQQDKLDLFSNIAWMYEHNNDPFTQLASTLDRKANIVSRNHGSETTWRHFIIGLYRDKVIGAGDITSSQLSQITKLWALVGLPAVEFKKIS